MTFRLVGGDAIEAMQAMAENSVDAIVTDPPYGLEFMGKEWDRFASQDTTARVQRSGSSGFGESKFRTGTKGVRNTFRCRSCGGWSGSFSEARAKRQRACECPNPDLDYAGAPSALLAFGEFSHAWATEALRILKPGGHLLAFGGTRTYHRLACAIEDAGFEIRDCIAWMYGSGFPKSLDVSKAIDKARDDYEPVRAVVEFIRAATEAAGMTRADLEALLGGSAVAAHFLATSRSNAGCPSWDQWLSLKGLLRFGDEMDAEVWRLNGRKGTPGENWDKREVLGKSDELLGRKSGIGNGAADHYTVGGTVAAAYDITAPATPEAQRWNGWGTALKPAFEPIVLARKPLAERNVAANVQRWGTGALNIDGCRIEHASADDLATSQGKNPGRDDLVTSDVYGAGRPQQSVNDSGRWPANVTLDETAAAMLDDQTGELHTQDPRTRRGSSSPGRVNGSGETGWAAAAMTAYGDTGGASRFFYCPKADREERNRGLDGFAEGPSYMVENGSKTAGAANGIRYERHTVTRNSHPTVKPVELMRWLCRMVTPKGGTVLDPFTGSGSTGVAAMREGFEFIGIEREAEYVEIARARIIGDAPLFNVEAESV